MRFLRYKDLKREKGIPWSRQHVLRLEKANRFPKRQWLGDNTSGWPEQVIDDYMAATLSSQRGWRARKAAGSGRAT